MGSCAVGGEGVGGGWRSGMFGGSFSAVWLKVIVIFSSRCYFSQKSGGEFLECWAKGNCGCIRQLVNIRPSRKVF